MTTPVLTLSIQNDRIRGVMHDRSISDLLYSTPGHYRDSKSPNLWSWPATPATAGSQVAALVGREVRFDEEWIALYQQFDREQRAALLAKSTDIANLSYPPSKTKPWDHQRRAYAVLSSLSSGGLFADMGTGKTKVAIDLILNGPAGDVLIVGPKRGISAVWPKEFRVHTDAEIELILLTGRLISRVDALDREPGPLRRVYLLNYEACPDPNVQAALSRHRWATIVLDEAHRIKSPTSSTSRFLALLGRGAERRYALTGTPASDKPLDVFGIYRFLDPGIFGISFTAFRDRYAITRNQITRTGQPFTEILGYQNLEELSERIYRLAFRVTDDILDLPAQNDVHVRVQLDGLNRRLYQRMHLDSVVELEGEDVVAKNAVGILLRLQQITSGFLPMEEGGINEFGSEKEEALLELLEDAPLDDPIVVFARFKHDLWAAKRAARTAKRAVYELSGDRDELLAWQSANGGEVLVVQIRAGGVAVETVRANRVVYMSHTFSLTDYQQSRKRSHRPGQTRPVTYWHLIAENTVDEYIVEALAAKKDVTDYVVDQLQKENR